MAAIVFMDYENGLDSGTGVDFANALKTINGCTAAKGVAAGTVVKVAKSPDPTSLGQTALWTEFSKAVVLQSAAVNATVLECDGTTGWTSDDGVNVALANNTTNYKLGTANGKANNRSSQIQIGAGFGTGLAAHADLGAAGLDLSAYRQVSFWILSSVDTLAAGNLTLDLCSDQAGTTPVLTCSIPRLYAGQFTALTFDLGAGNLGTIKSVALNVAVDFAAANISLDNIIACKAPTADDSLSLTSLISKNSAAQGGTEPWYAIQSINGTSIFIDNHTNCNGNAGYGYDGATETVTTYKRETIPTDMAATANAAVQTCQVSGSEASLVQFEGGYNTTTGEQDGETFFSGQNGFGLPLSANNKIFNKLNHIHFYRYNNFLSNNYLMTGWEINNIACCHHTNIGIILGSPYPLRSNISVWAANNNGSSGMQIGTPAGGRDCVLSISNCSNNIGRNVSFYNVVDFVIATLTAKNNPVYSGVSLRNLVHNVKIMELVTKGNANAIDFFLQYGSAKLVVVNADITEATKISGQTDYYGDEIVFENLAGTPGNNFIYRAGATILSDTTAGNLHGDAVMAWKFSITSAGLYAATYPLKLKVAELGVKSGKDATVSCWMKRSNTGLTMKLVCPGGQVGGPVADVSATMDDSGVGGADNYAQVSITIPAASITIANTVLDIEVWVYGNVYDGWVSDFGFSQVA